MTVGRLKDEADLERWLLGKLEDQRLLPANPSVGFSPGDVKGSLISEAPGWLLCDGSEVSRTKYADLYKAIGAVVGPGDGSSTFNLPDFRGRGLVGLGTHADVNSLTDSDGLEASARTPKHTHGFSGTTSTGSTEQGMASGIFGVNLNTHTHTFSGTTGSGNMGYAVVYWLVKG